MQPLPDTYLARVQFLERLFDVIVHSIKPLMAGKVPHLKIFRVLAALYPEAMTTVANRTSLKLLVGAMGGDGGLSPIERHLWVRRRLDGLLGAPHGDVEALAERLALPWMLYERFVRPAGHPRGESDTVEQHDDTTLSPLPAARRRRGLTPIRGLFTNVLSVLEFVRSGVSRSELIDFLRASSPDAKTTSLGLTINVLEGELGAIRRERDLYLPTERGQRVLDTQDSIHFADWLLTRVLGVDTAIAELRDRGPLTPSALTAIVRTANPNWQTDFVPQSIVSWLRSLKVIDMDDQSRLALTEAGREWARRITWPPEAIPAEPGVPEPPNVEVERPSFDGIAGVVARAGHFPADLIAQLHAGLWAHERRHFAILTGLSGSGKTLLARSYADALTGGVDHQRLTQPVQPGWYDPGPLLGYSNPLRTNSYVRTGFLDFLIAAVNDPAHPYVVVLDEMNLSHPEQYMAPLLSAMETGEAIRLHSEEALLDDVPAAIPYPRNLVLIGTVNMDETTHGLSDKVLDRAFVLEFWEVDIEAYPRWGQRSLDAANERVARNLLTELMKALSPARLHFGWRVIDDVLDFLTRAAEAGASLPFEAALDAVIFAKVLPKLRGDDGPRFRDALKNCGNTVTLFQLERSRAKIDELTRDLHTTGSARFWR